jgi:hypothetical protein
MYQVFAPAPLSPRKNLRCRRGCLPHLIRFFLNPFLTVGRAFRASDGACVLTDSDGDQIFSIFDTRDTDKSQPQMNCGTHIITGGTGKYKGITGSEPFACITMPALADPGGYTAMDIPHNTTWEIK